MKPQSRDSYQPRDIGDHSNRWIRGGEGSIAEGRWRGIEGVFGAVRVGDDWLGVVVEARSVRMVCRGSEGSQESIYNEC